MTFIVGLTCSDGIVLCTDSLEDDGITKKTVDKIMMMGNSHWGLAIAGSGPGSTIDKFGAALNAKLPRGQFDEALIESEIEKELADFNSKYVNTSGDQFHVIVASYSNPAGHRFLYKGSCFGVGQSVVLSPVMGECHTGMGNEIWRLLSDTLYRRTNGVADNIRLAVFATRLAIKYASGVDGPVQAVSYTFGDQSWKMYSREEIKDIESDVSLEAFRDALQKYWRLHNPPTR